MSIATSGPSPKYQGPLFESVRRLRTVFGNYRPIGLIPIRIEEKIPAVEWRLVNERGYGFTEEELTRVWTERFNIGIVTGPVSQGLWVVDCDGQEAIAWAEQNLPPTPMVVKTPNGLHRYYRSTAGANPRSRADILGSKAKFAHQAEHELGLFVRPRPLENADPSAIAEENLRARADMARARVLLKMGPVIDVRGKGGQALAPGSISKKGVPYQAINEWTPELFDATDVLPEDALDRFEKWRKPVAPVTTPPPRSSISNSAQNLSRATAWLRSVPGAVSGQGGHDHTFKTACSLVNGFDLPQEDALVLMKSWNNTCDPPWSDEDLRHKVKDAADRPDERGRGYHLIDRPEFLAKKKLSRIDEALAKIPEKKKAEEPGVDDGEPRVFQPRTNKRLSDKEDREPEDDLAVFSSDEMSRLFDKFGIDYEELQAKGENNYTITVKKDSRGRPVRMILPPETNNLALVLKYSSEFRDAFEFEDLKMMPVFRGEPWSDAKGFKHCVCRLDTLFGGKVSLQKARCVIEGALEENPTNTVIKHCDSFKPRTDNIDYIDKFLINILKINKEEAGDNYPIYYRMFQNTMVGMLARMRNPGCKMDTVLILKGDQGQGKSTFFKYLLPKGFVAGGKFDFQNKDGLMVVGCHVVIEMAEFTNQKREHLVDDMKAFLSETEDIFRKPYGKGVVTVPRRCIFVASVNDDQFLDDETGNRRFYVIPANGEIMEDDVLALKDGLWSQINDIYERHIKSEKGSKEYDETRWWFRNSDPMELKRKELVSNNEKQDPWKQDIEEYAASKEGQNINIRDVLISKLNIPIELHNVKMQRRVGKVLTYFGCKHVQVKNETTGRRVWCFRVPIRSSGGEMSEAARSLMSIQADER